MVATLFWERRCHALRIASVQARDEGWMAEHMLILKIDQSSRTVKYLTGLFLQPAANQSGNADSNHPRMEGGTVGDDIGVDEIRRGWAALRDQSEHGFFGVAPGTSMEFEQERHAPRRLEIPFSPTVP